MEYIVITLIVVLVFKLLVSEPKTVIGEVVKRKSDAVIERVGNKFILNEK